MKYAGIIGALIGLQGCALLDDLNKIEENKRRVCNYDGAFAEGLKDAKAGLAMNSESVRISCKDTPRGEEASRGYREGYMTGKKSP